MEVYRAGAGDMEGGNSKEVRGDNKNDRET